MTVLWRALAVLGAYLVASVTAGIVLTLAILRPDPAVMLDESWLAGRNAGTPSR